MKVTTTVPQSVTFSQSHHAIVTLANSRGSATSNFTVTQAGNKDNVYIVTLPQHQVKQGLHWCALRSMLLQGGESPVNQLKKVFTVFTQYRILLNLFAAESVKQGLTHTYPQTSQKSLDKVLSLATR